MFFGNVERLRVAVTFEKEVNSFDTLTTMLGVDVEFLIASATVVKKLLVAPESVIFDSVLSGEVSYGIYLQLKLVYCKSITKF